MSGRLFPKVFDRLPSSFAVFEENNFAIPFSDLTLVRKIGSGSFGEVYEGRYKDAKVLRAKSICHVFLGQVVLNFTSRWRSKFKLSLKRRS